MFDIDTFIRMVRIVPSNFVACEDYIFHDSISSFIAAYFSHMRVLQFYFQLSSFTLSNQEAVQFLHFTLYDPVVAATFLSPGSSTFWVSGGMLFSNFNHVIP